MGPQPPENRASPIYVWNETHPKSKAKAAIPPSREKALYNWNATPASGVAAASEDVTSVPEERLIDKISRVSTQSISKSAVGVDFGDIYDKAYRSIKSVMPEGYSDSYVGRLTEHLLRAAPEAADFFTSPMGAALVLGHMFPLTAPVAVVGDLVLGGYQILRSIPSIADAVRDPKDPVKVADAAKDAIFAFGAFKGAREFTGKPEFKRSLDRPIEAKRVVDILRNAPLEEKLQLADRISQPLTRRANMRAKLYHMPILSTAGAILDVRRPKIMEAAGYLIDDRDNFIGAAKLEAAKLIYDFRKEVPKEERDVKKIGYVLEGSATADEVGLSPAAKQWVSAIRDWQKKVEGMYHSAYGDDIALHDPETYLMHKWGFDNEGEMVHKGGTMGVGRRLLRDPQFRARSVATYKQGIEEFGYKPAMDDVADLLWQRHQIAATAIGNQRVANILNEMGLIVAEDETYGKGERQDILKRWPTLESKPLERAAYVGKTDSGRPIFRPKPVRVHPEIKMPLEAIFGEGYPLRNPQTGKLTFKGGIEQLRSFGKQQAVSVSLFHHWAISEQSQAMALGTNPGMKGLAGAAKGTFFLNPDWYSGLKTGLYEIREKAKGDAPPVLGIKHGAALDWTRHGLRLGTADAEGAIVEATRKWHAENKVLDSTVGKALRGWGKVQYINNRALWDFYLPSQMIFSAETIFSKEMSLHPRKTAEEIAALKTEISKHVNKVLGTENLEAIGLNPKTRYWMNVFLFAPVWTFSNFRVLTNGFQTETGHKLRGRWIGGAAFAWWVTSNLTNYLTTGWVYSGQDGPMPDKDGVRRPHFMWDNPGSPAHMGGKWTLSLTENAHRIAMGYNPDGTESYIRYGKGYEEPIYAFLDPRAYFSGKMGLFPKTVAAILTGHEPGTGYQVVDTTLAAGEQAFQYGALASELVLPFVAQDASKWLQRKMFPEIVPETGSTQASVPIIGGIKAPLGLPTRKGLSQQRAVDAYEAAMKDATLDADTRNAILGAIMRAADANHIPRQKVYAGYRDRQRKRQRTARGPKDVYDQYGNIQSPPEVR